MTKFHYWSLKWTIAAWGALIVSASIKSPWLWVPLVVASLGAFACDWHCMKHIKKGQKEGYDAEDRPESWAFHEGVKFAERAHDIGGDK